MRLTDLEPDLVKLTEPGYMQDVDSISEADGVLFLCPVCFQSNGGPVGTHSILCWQPHVPRSEPPTSGRWRFEGTGLDDLTLTPSIHLSGPGCGAHFFIRGGQIV